MSSSSKQAANPSSSKGKGKKDDPVVSDSALKRYFAYRDSLLAPPAPPGGAGIWGNDDEEMEESPAPTGSDVEDEEIETCERLAGRMQEDGYLPLIQKAYEDECATGTRWATDMAKFPHYWQDACYETLCMMQPEVIQVIIHGGIEVVYQNNLDIQDHLDMLYTHAAEPSPSIYIYTIVDRQGEHVSADHLAQVSRVLRTYARPKPPYVDKVDYETWSTTVSMIDGAFGERVESIDEPTFQPRYLPSTRDDTTSRRRTLLTFLDGMDAQLLKPNVEQNGLPLQYIGYAMDAQAREAQHQKRGASSNWLSTLVQSTLEALNPRIYHMRLRVICPIVDPSQGVIAECVLTRLANSYYHGGRGFNIAPAGKSMESIRKLDTPPDEREVFWANQYLWVRDNTGYAPHYEHQVELKERYEKRMFQARMDAMSREITGYYEKSNAAYKRLESEGIIDDIDNDDDDEPLFEDPEMEASYRRTMGKARKFVKAVQEWNTKVDEEERPSQRPPPQGPAPKGPALRRPPPKRQPPKSASQAGPSK